MDCVHELARIFHAKVEPLEVSVAVCVVAHEAVESVIGAQAYLVQIGTLKVGVEGQGRLVRLVEVGVEGYDLPLSVGYSGGLCAATTPLPSVDGSFEVSRGGERTLLDNPIPSARVTAIILRISVLHIRCGSDETMHSLDLARVLGQVSLVFTSKNDVLVVRPPYFLIRQEIVACLFLLSLNLLLEPGCNISKSLLTGTALSSQTLS